ncbi:MAG: Rieske 2Fe-2S domain-containing protein [Ktedonobacterales bacterium]
MELLEAMNVIEEQSWLEAPGDTVATVVSKVLTRPEGGPTRIDDFLNGVWLGHPLHPVLVAVPIGAWTMTGVLDGIETLTGTTELNAGADAATAVGLLGAVASAVTGAAQWQYTIGRQRRLGFAHALINLTAAGLYGASLLCRVNGKRGAGKLTALLGYGVVMIGGYIGGELVYGERLGVTHIPEQTLPDEFQPALREEELHEGDLKRVTIADVPVLLVRQHGRIYALAEMCAHLGGPLAEGTLGECSVTCPWHGSRYRLTDGMMLNGPATFPQPVYETRVHNGMIEVRPSAPQPEG